MLARQQNAHHPAWTPAVGARRTWPPAVTSWPSCTLRPVRGRRVLSVLRRLTRAQRCSAGSLVPVPVFDAYAAAARFLTASAVGHRPPPLVNLGQHLLTEPARAATRFTTWSASTPRPGHHADDPALLRRATGRLFRLLPVCGPCPGQHVASWVPPPPPAPAARRPISPSLSAPAMRLRGLEAERPNRNAAVRLRPASAGPRCRADPCAIQRPSWPPGLWISPRPPPDRPWPPPEGGRPGLRSQGPPGLGGCCRGRGALGRPGCARGQQRAVRTRVLASLAETTRRPAALLADARLCTDADIGGPPDHAFALTSLGLRQG